MLQLECFCLIKISYKNIYPFLTLFSFNWSPLKSFLQWITFYWEDQIIFYLHSRVYRFICLNNSIICHYRFIDHFWYHGIWLQIKYLHNNILSFFYLLQWAEFFLIYLNLVFIDPLTTAAQYIKCALIFQKWYNNP